MLGRSVGRSLFICELVLVGLFFSMLGLSVPRNGPMLGLYYVRVTNTALHQKPLKLSGPVRLRQISRQDKEQHLG